MKTKRILAVILAVLICISITACGNTDTTQPSTQPVSTVEATTPPPTQTLISEESPLDILEWVECNGYELDESQPVKNIILMIGDGMGENIITNAEIVKGSPLATSFMPYTCHVGTDSLDGTTDSAAASTAISCGIKTDNESIGVDKDDNPVETIVEFSKARGLKTGLVATHLIPHATPAGMVAHHNYRNDFNTIMKQMIKANVDVMFGGGGEYADTPKMQTRIEDGGYKYITTTEEMSTLSKGMTAFGCFAYHDLNSEETPSLTTMTSKALELLENDNGFFLMVEASHIDIFEAEQDMDKTLIEMQAFDKAIDYVLTWAQDNPGTLVIVTADHETGGVLVPESGKAEDVNNSCFTSEGEHTSTDVMLFAAGAQAGNLFTKDRIENTEISAIMRKALNDTYGEAPVTLLNVE